MEFLIEKTALLQALYFAQGIADRKATMPILANVLIRTLGSGRIMLAATDLNMTVQAEVASQVESEGGFTVSARYFYDLVKSISAEHIRIRHEADRHVEIFSGKIHYQLVGLNDIDFPKIPDCSKVPFLPLDASVFLDLIKKTYFSISSDETRYHLNGALFECSGGTHGIARMVSTDGHRLSKCEHPVSQAPSIQPGILIPRRALGEIRRLLEGSASSVDVGTYMGHFFVKSGGLVLAVKLQEAQFPPYQQVIPKTSSRTAIMNRLAILESLKRISLMTSEKTWGVKCTLMPDVLQLEADSPTLGHGKEELGLSYQGAPLSIGFNAKYLIELLSEMDSSSVKLECSGELDPGVLRPHSDTDRPLGDYLGVVMPMRI